MESAPAPLVSIVLLNWNSGDLGVAAAQSAVAQTGVRLELVVVDNASVDDSLERILRVVDPDVVVRNTENLGFSGGMNSGFAASAGSYVLPLNCDVELEPDYVAATLRVLQADEETAAVGGRVTSPRSGLTGPIRVTATMRTRPLEPATAQFCDKVDGSCPLHRRAAIEQVMATWNQSGPYDESYDTYGEDIDLALKYARLGWKIRYTPSAAARHVRSFSSAHRLADRRGRLRINNLANRHRNLLRHGRPALTPALVAQDLAFVGMQLLRRDRHVLPDVWRSWRRVLQHRRGDLDVRRRP